MAVLKGLFKGVRLLKTVNSLPPTISATRANEDVGISATTADIDSQKLSHSAVSMIRPDLDG